MINSTRGEATSAQVILVGRLLRNGDTIVEVSSTVTLVVSAEKRVVVDTGSRANAERLRKALSAASLKPEEVDMVVNTHLHLDHIGGNELFPNAKFYAHCMESPPVGTIKVSDVLDLLPGVRILHTPGHTAGSISVLVEADKRYSICGDAIPTQANIEQHVPPSININPSLALKSLDALEMFADVIVPGHGASFAVIGKR